MLLGHNDFDMTFTRDELARVASISKITIHHDGNYYEIEWRLRSAQLPPVDNVMFTLIRSGGRVILCIISLRTLLCPTE